MDVMIRRPPTFFLVLITLFSANGLTAEMPFQVVISEFLASNQTGLQDAQGERYDWIEIYNRGSKAVNLEGWSLTDDEDVPLKWVFPATELRAKDYLLVYGVGSNRAPSESPSSSSDRQANFKLSTKGEYLALIDSNGHRQEVGLTDAREYPEQQPDISYGLNTNHQWAFFTTPTPGAANTNGYAGLVKETRFSVDRGFYESPFQLSLSTDTADAEIYYTTDGSEPSPEQGRRYQSSIEISTTSIVRARAFKENWLPSNIATHTYLFLSDVIRQPQQPEGYPTTWYVSAADYGMDSRVTNHPDYREHIREALRSHPTLSLVLDRQSLFNRTTGIYVNPQASGDAWERAVSAEFFDFSDGREIQVDAGLRMQGNASRSPSRPKHNMRLTFRRQYGSGRLNFKVFDNTEVDAFNNLILRGQNGDSWIHPNANQRKRAQYIRDQWHRDVQRSMGHASLNQGHFHLYINGLYWGFYHVFERVEAEFMAENFGGEEEDYDVIKDLNRAAGRVTPIDGNLNAWNRMMQLGAESGVRTEAFYEIQQWLDLDNFVDYMLLNFYSGNTDWDSSNWRAGRRREEGRGYRFFPWDSERTVGDAAQSSVALGTNTTGRNIANRPSGLHQQLARNEDYRLFFADRIQRHFFNGGALSPEGAARLWNQRVEELQLPLIAEAARWGDAHRPSQPYTPNEEWIREATNLRNLYFPQRTGIVLDQLANQGLWPRVEAPTFHPRESEIETGTLVQLRANSGARIYYTLDGSDPRSPGGDIHPQAQLGRQVPIVRASSLRARAKLNNEWSPLNEFPYRPRQAKKLQVVQAQGDGALGGIVVSFNRPPDPATALAPENYTLLGQNASVQGVRLLDDYSVVLNLTPYTTQQSSLAISQIRDLADSRMVLPDSLIDIDMRDSNNVTYGPIEVTPTLKDQLVLEGETATFQAIKESAPDGTALRWIIGNEQADESSAHLTILNTRQTQDATPVRFELFNLNGSYNRVESADALLHVIPDRLPPALIDVYGSGNQVTLHFHESLNRASASNPENYQIMNLEVREARYLEDQKAVQLTTANQKPLADYTIELGPIADRSDRANILRSAVRFQSADTNYASEVLKDDPVRFWRFDQPSAPAFESEVSENDPLSATTATPAGGAEILPGGLVESQSHGGALQLSSASNGRVNIPNGSDLNITRGPWQHKTIELWFRATLRPSGDQALTLYEQGGGTRALALYLQTPPDGVAMDETKLYWFAFNNSAGDGADASWGPAFNNAVWCEATIRINQTYHAVAVMDGNNSPALEGLLALYINGQIADRETGVGRIYNHSGDIRIGDGNYRRHDNRNGDTGHFGGLIDELALYNKALSSTRIRAHYLAGTRHARTPRRFAPFIQSAVSKNHLVVEFSGVLESSLSPLGPWFRVKAQSPFLLSPTQAPIHQYFRSVTP